MVNAAASEIQTVIKLDTTQTLNSHAVAVVLTGPSTTAMNSFGQPGVVVPVESVIQDASTSFHRGFPANSMTVIALQWLALNRDRLRT